MKFDVVIIGGGAAGLMCAIEAGKRRRRVAILEHSDVVGKKIRISGGGRCNFTNTLTSADNFISGNASFPKSALSRYTPVDFIQLVRKHRIDFYEKKLGQLFCNTTSQVIIDMLLGECAEKGVEVKTSCSVSQVSKTGEGFKVESNLGTMTCQSLVIATGGLSIPKIGATDFGYRIAHQFGLGIIQTRPGLVPLTVHEDFQPFKMLSGVSADVSVSCRGTTFRENLLFTHRGLSGPAMLQISSYWKPGESVTIDLLPETEDVDRLAKRLLQKWNELYAPARPVAQWSRKQLQEYRDRLHRWKIYPSGTEGYAKAEVTAGGVDTDDLSSKTMESKQVRGLYFIGEVVDVTGQLGGFNFQWAWASGFVSGQYV